MSLATRLITSWELESAWSKIAAFLDFHKCQRIRRTMSSRTLSGRGVLTPISQGSFIWAAVRSPYECNKVHTRINNWFFPHGCTSTNSTMLTWWQYDTEVHSYSTISFSSTAAVSGAMEQWDVKSIFALAGEISMVNFRSCVIRNQIILHARVKSACLLTKSRKDNHA